MLIRIYSICRIAGMADWGYYQTNAGPLRLLEMALLRAATDQRGRAIACPVFQQAQPTHSRRAAKLAPARRVRNSCRSIRIAMTAPSFRTTTPDATS